MAEEIARAGIDTYCLYGAEDTYGTKATTINIHFGILQSFSPTNRNNLIKIRGFKGTTTGGRDMIKALGGKFETSQSIDFQPQHFDWLQYVLGSRTGSGTAGSPYVYTGSDSLTPLTITSNKEMGDTDRMMAYLGCKINSMTIKSAFGEPVSVTLDVIAADIDKSSTLESTVALDASDVYAFSGSKIEWPNATQITNVIDSFELTLANNAEILYGLGSRVGQKGIVKQREHTFKITMKSEDETYVDAFLGSATGPSAPTEVATVEFNLTGGTNHTCAFLYAGVTLDDWNDPETYGEVVPEELTGIAETLTVTEQQTSA